MTVPSPREWGKEQAAKSPTWSEDKWRRIGRILGVEFVTEPAAPKSGKRGERAA